MQQRPIVTLFVGIALLSVAIPANSAGPSHIVAGATTIVSAQARRDPFAESFLAVNPQHPSHLVATALTVRGNELDSALYQSLDAGAHWKPVDTGSHFDTADPIVYFGPSGRAFFESEASGGLNLMTSDNLRTWKPFRYTRVGKFFDRPYIGFDTEGPFKGRMYLSAYVEMYDASGGEHGTMAVTSSSDNGRTFSTPLIIDIAGKSSGFDVDIPADILVTPDGTVVLPYEFEVFDPKHIPHGPHRGTYNVLISKDGGVSFTGVRAADVVSYCCKSYRSTAMSGGTRGTVDLSQSAYRGRLYLVWANYNGSGTDIDIVSSSDDGHTWSKPVRVNDNRTAADDANPVAAVNGRGVLAVVWNDRRNAHGSSCYELYGSASLDGGKTFLPNSRLSKAVTCPNSAGNWKPVLLMEQQQPGTPDEKWLNVLTVATRWPNGGDTQGLQALPHGDFGAAWIDGASGVMQLAYTRFRVQGSTASTPPPLQTPASVSAKSLSSQLDLNVVAGTFDPSRGIFSVKLQLKNASAALIRGPFSVVLKRTMSNLPNLRATNADNHLTGKGSAWTLGSDALLRPGDATPVRTATWKFKGYPKAPEYPVFIFEVKQQ